MTLSRHRKIAFAITALLFSTLACHAATRLIFPDTPTLQPTDTATNTQAASCPLVVNQIIADSTSSEGNASSSETTSDAEVTYLVQYAVTGEEIKNPHFESVTNDLTDEQADRPTHEEIWKYFTRLIPAEQRALVTNFSIFTDGEYNLLASVNQSNHDPDQWELNVDFADSNQKTSLTFTLIHEFGHLLTLNSKQVPINLPVYNHPDNNNIYQTEVAACPQYFTGEGCSNSDSYINVFFERFWTDFYTEWQKIDNVKDEDTRQNQLDDFYNTYQDQFLTDYAPTSPAEDIAEAWAFFILAPKPESTSRANEKILFFYEYPELVQLRAQILDKICVEFQ